MQITQEKILHFLEELKPSLEAKGIQKIALFGSYATNRENVYSDIDIAIQKEPNFLKKHSPYEYFEILNTLKETVSQKLHRNIDLFDLDSNSSFLHTIQKELIYV
ncbi:MAG TPA: nucleotidyltransferase domain-containing protein [Campylobacterales bacterium]|nr:nucleotidyltransferase domain-containing protein [Campylobacterales bacterium]